MRTSYSSSGSPFCSPCSYLSSVADFRGFPYPFCALHNVELSERVLMATRCITCMTAGKPWVAKPSPLTVPTLCLDLEDK